jgi:hypothetical protein
LQQIYQGLRPGNETFRVETVKRIANVSDAIDFLRVIEELNRWSRKHIVLDCTTDLAKDIVVSHVRDITLGKRTYHYLLSGLVSLLVSFLLFQFDKGCPFSLARVEDENPFFLFSFHVPFLRRHGGWNEGCV